MPTADPRSDEPLASPDVTVCIVSHGAPELVLDCLRSLGDDAGRRRSLEVVVIDNASEDSSAAVIREAYPDVRVIERHDRAGFGANHNLGAREARGRYLFILNNDTVVEPGSIDALVDYLDQNPRVAVAGPRVLTAQGELDTFVFHFPSLRRSFRNAVWPWRPVEPWPGLQSLRVAWVNGCAFLVRRDAFVEVGGFDEGFFMYGEEKDLCKRLSERGGEAHLVPGTGVIHLGARSTERVPERRSNEFWRSQRRYLRKHLSAPAARGALVLDAIANAELWFAAAALGALPSGLRPSRMRPGAANDYRTQALGALRARGPGLRELADEWNRRHRQSAAGT